MIARSEVDQCQDAANKLGKKCDAEKKKLIYISLYKTMNQDSFQCPPGWLTAKSFTKRALTDTMVFLEPRADPPGCVFRVPDNDVYFNAPEEGVRASGSFVAAWRPEE